MNWLVLLLSCQVIRFFYRELWIHKFRKFFLIFQVAKGKFFINSYNITHDSKINNVTFYMTTGYLHVDRFFYRLDIWSRFSYVTESCEWNIYRVWIFFMPLLVSVEVIGQLNKQMDQYDWSLLKTTINLCDVEKTMVANTWLKRIFKPLVDCVKYDIKCPFTPVSKFYCDWNPQNLKLLLLGSFPGWLQPSWSVQR